MINPTTVSRADPLLTVNIEELSANPIFDELFDEIIRGERTHFDDESFAEPKSRSYRRRRTYAVAAIAAMVVAVTVGVVVTTSGPSAPPGQQTTPWEASRSLPSSRIPTAGGAPHSWELVGDFVPTGWQLRTSGPRPGAVDCPTTSTCYVLGNTATKASGPASYGAFYVSNDFGASWSVLPVPGGLTAATPVSCPSALTCDFGALLNHKAVLVTTTNGGHQWTITPMSRGGQFTALTCFPDGACNGLIVAHATGPVSEGHIGAAMQPAIFVRTTDGGSTWYRHRLQPLQFAVAAAMSCSDSRSCVIHGYSFAHATTLFPVETTEDGGRTWTAGMLPEGFSSAGGEISCPTSSNCIVAGQTAIPGKTPCITTSAGLLNPKTCTFGPSGRGAIATTSDGGRSWHISSTFPTDASIVDGVKCASATVCWVTGHSFSGLSAALWGTFNGGANWTKVALTIPPGAPEDIGGDSYDSIGRISCPTAQACLALGVVDQGSASTPVYSFIAPSSGS
jgi:photosystem II stability/assembly factor-like uncharacterized protein